jgi:hypothetical protein
MQHEFKSRIAMVNAASSKKKYIVRSKLDLTLRWKPEKFCIWSTAVYGAET